MNHCHFPTRLLLLAILIAGCGHPPAAQVTGAKEIGTVSQSPLILGRDGGWSARLWAQQIFVFGDTFTSVADANHSTFHSNSFSATTDFLASDGISGMKETVDAAGSPIPLIPSTPDEAAFIAAHKGDNGTCMVKPCGARWAMWPAAMVFDAARDQAIISYGLVHAEPGDFAFYSVGVSLALWSSLKQSAVRPTLTHGGNCPDHPTLMFCQKEPTWGTAMVLEGTDLYLFACDKDGLSFHCSLARVPVAQAIDRSQWTAWDGSGWSALGSAKAVFDGAPIMRVYFNHHINAWMAIYSGPVSNDVHFRTAPALTGPWSDEAKLFTADHKVNDGNWVYDALVQPDYAEDNDRIQYVTFSRPNAHPFQSDMVLERVEFQ